MNWKTTLLKWINVYSYSKKKLKIFIWDQNKADLVKYTDYAFIQEILIDLTLFDY